MTTNTKTRKPKTSSTDVLDTIKALEDQILSDVAAAHSAIAEATAKVAHWESEAEDARGAVEDIEDAWSAGDDALTADDHTRALAEAKRAESLLSAARSALAIAERKAKVNTDTVGPDAVASVLREILPSEYVQTVATFAPVPAGLTEPVCIVASVGADDAPTARGFGEFDQPFTITYTRAPMYAALTAAEVERQAEALGVTLETLGAAQTHNDGTLKVDVIRGKVYKAHHTVPKIVAHPSEAIMRTVGLNLADDAAEIAGRDLDGEARVRAARAAVKIEDGKRTSTLTATVGFQWKPRNYANNGSSFGYAANRSSKDRVESRAPMEALDEAVPQMVGTFIKGAGIVTAATSEPAEAITVSANPTRPVVFMARRITITSTSQVEGV